MGHCRLYLVIAVLLPACAPDLPRDVYIDDRFDETEETAIKEQIDELNRTGQELIGRDLVVYRGRYVDADGFTLDDADDDMNVVYKLTGPDDNTRYLDQAEGGGGEGIIGYSLHHDTLIYSFRLPHSSTDGSVCIPAIITELVPGDSRESGGGGASRLPHDYRPNAIGYSLTPSDEQGDCDGKGYSIRPDMLKQVFLHEMGHFIGLSHIDDPKALMYPYANGTQSFTETDKRLFCCLYECITNKYSCDWSKVTHDHVGIM